MTTASYHQASEARIVLQAGSSNAATIKGLNTMKLPGLTRSTIQVEEFGVDFAPTVTGGGSYGTITASGNLVVGDTTGQDLLKTYLTANTLKTDIRFYLNYTTGLFLTCDLANDASAGFYVVRYEPGQADKNGIFPFDCEFAVAGQTAYFNVTYTADTIALVDNLGADSTITDSASGFVTAGFVAGQTLIIEGSTADDGQYLIKTVAAGVITLDGEVIVTGETAGADISLHAGKL